MRKELKGLKRILHSLAAMAAAIAATAIALAWAPGALAGDALPLAAGICVDRAQVAFHKGNISEAVDILAEFRARARGKSPEAIQRKGYDHCYVHFLYGNYSLTLSQDADGAAARRLLDQAMTGFEQAVEKDPGFSEAWLNLAKCRYESGAHARAADAFERGYDTSETPKPVILYYAAVCRFRADDPQRALTLFEKLESTHSGSVRLPWKETLVHVFFSLERYRQALPVIETLAARSEPEKRKQWQEILLQQYLALGMNKKALALARELTAIDPMAPKWWKALCHIHLAGQRNKQGLAALIVYGYLTPWTRQETLLAADLYLSLDVPAQAAGLYGQALNASPDLPQIRKASQACLLAHDHKTALAWIEKGLARKKDKTLQRMKDYIVAVSQRPALQP